MGIEKYFDIELGLLKTEYCEPFYAKHKFTDDQKLIFRKEISFNILAKFLLKLDPLLPEIETTKVNTKEEAINFLETLSNNPNIKDLITSFIDTEIESILNEWHKKLN